MFWPFKKKQKPEIRVVPIAELSVSQLDITEGFGDNASLPPDAWVKTSPMNIEMRDPESMGLPPATATEDEVYRIASELSRIREQIPVPDDGVYCPICHIANVDINRLRKPCPKCGKPLLKFGWH